MREAFAPILMLPNTSAVSSHETLGLHVISMHSRPVPRSEVLPPVLPVPVLPKPVLPKPVLLRPVLLPRSPLPL